ncbi:MAG: nitroreductase family protein [Bacteroidales bacterium]|nr:nitroreductase family protein [Bacteroidales bacterium]
MEILLDIDRAKCIKCGKCVKVCPSKIFVWNRGNNTASVKVEEPQNCIKCGHCAAVCQAGAINHSLFPKEKVHSVDFSQMPSPEQVMLLCKARRSNRALTANPVPKETIQKILEAANTAPTASNLQELEYTVVSSPAKITEVIEFVIDYFSSMVKLLENPLLKPILKPLLGNGAYRYVNIFRRIREEYSKGNDQILRGAKCVIFIHAPKSSRFADADANLAYQNGSLMAESMGISQIYTGFVCTAAKKGKGRLEEILGIDKNRRIVAGMALGVPEFRYPNYIERGELKAKEI